MNPFTMQRHPSMYRFLLPNEIWQWNLKPAAFAILAYLQYRSCRKIHGVPAIRELAMRTKMSIQMAERQVDVLADRGLVTCSLLPTWSPPKSGNFFTLPDKLFYLNLGHGPITVYAYLLCCEDRRTHQCHPSYNTIADAAGLSVISGGESCPEGRAKSCGLSHRLRRTREPVCPVCSWETIPRRAGRQAGPGAGLGVFL